MVIDLTQRTSTLSPTILRPMADMVQKNSGDSGHPPLKHEDLSHEDGLQVIDGFYPSPDPPAAHHLSPTSQLDEPSDLPTVTDEHSGTPMADIGAKESIGSVIDFQAQPEDAPTRPDSLEANRLTLRPCKTAAPPINSSAKHLRHFDPPELPMKSSSSKSELQAEMRHEELVASSPLFSMPAPVPFSLSKVRHGALAKRRAASSSSPLAARQPIPKKSKRAPQTASSPLMLFEDLPSFSETSAASRHSSTSNTTRAAVAKSRPRYISSSRNRGDHLVAGGGGGGDIIGNVQSVSESEEEDDKNEDDEKEDDENEDDEKEDEEEEEEEEKPPEIKRKRKHKVTISPTTTTAAEEEQEEEDNAAPPPKPAPARRHRPPTVGSHELKNLAMDTFHNNHHHGNVLLENEKAATAASGSRGRQKRQKQQHIASPTQRVTTRLQRRERMASLPGVSTKEAVQRRRSKRGRGRGRGRGGGGEV